MSRRCFGRPNALTSNRQYTTIPTSYVINEQRVPQCWDKSEICMISPHSSEICKLIPGFKFLVPIYFEMSIADRHHDFSGLRTIIARRTRNLYICFLKKLLSSVTGATKFGRTRELTVRSSCTLLVQRSISGSIFSSERSRTLCYSLLILFPYYLLGIIPNIHMTTR